jgi:hypothetical protein
MQAVMRSLGVLRRLVEALGPYLVLELLLPGGTLFAVVLFMYQRRKLKFVSDARPTALPART